MGKRHLTRHVRTGRYSGWYELGGTMYYIEDCPVLYPIHTVYYFDWLQWWSDAAWISFGVLIAAAAYLGVRFLG